MYIWQQFTFNTRFAGFFRHQFRKYNPCVKTRHALMDLVPLLSLGRTDERTYDTYLSIFVYSRISQCTC